MLTGRRFADRYLILGEAGAGGMGTVHRAVDAQTGETIALKIVHADTADERVRFEREAAILGQLEHPGIVRYLDHGIAPDDSCYLAMEWVTGTTLADKLVDPGLTLRESVSIARQLAETLGAVHARGIVHRDVKPANIMFAAGGDPAATRLIDFGVARRVGDTQRLTRTGLMVGTPGYMAPEQARGTRMIDGRTDLFALGCVLYECVTGRPAFSGDHATAVRAKILADEPPPPHVFSGEVPERLEQLVLALLAKDPAGRPDSAEAVMIALHRVVTADEGSRRRSYTADAPTRRMPADAAIARSVFLVLTDLGGVPSATTLPAEHPSLHAQIRTTGAAHGASVEVMSDGRAFGVICAAGTGAGERDPSDPALRAGRLALAMRSAIPPPTPVVLSFAAGDDAFGRAIERAVILLGDAEVAAAMRTAPASGPAGLVRIDVDAAGILAESFEIDQDSQGHRLRRERQA